MSEYICFLITLLYHNQLIKVALQCKRADLPDDIGEYYMEDKEKLYALLPEHIQSLGPIVDIEIIFEVIVKG